MGPKAKKPNHHCQAKLLQISDTNGKDIKRGGDSERGRERTIWNKIEMQSLESRRFPARMRA